MELFSALPYLTEYECRVAVAALVIQGTVIGFTVSGWAEVPPMLD